MQNKKLITALVVTSILALTPVLHAQALGRLALKITDTQGNALSGAKVTITCDDLPAYHGEQSTNKKGKATIPFPDVTKVYNLEIELDGYVTANSPFKPTFGKADHETVVLQSRSVSAQAGPTTTTTNTLEFTLAERTFNSGVELLRQGDLDGAEAKFLEALEKDSQLSAAHGALGGIYLERKDFEAALASANRLLGLDGASLRAYRLLYEGHKGLGQQAEADAALARLGELDQSGDSAAMVYNEGVEAAKLGDNAGASKRFQEALALDPKLGAALSALAVIQMQTENWVEAAGLAERLLEMEPDNLKAKRIRYDAYNAAGDEEKAREALEQLAAVDPKGMATQLFGEGIKQFNSRDYVGAIRSFETSLEIDETLAKAHYHLGLIYTNQNNTEKARRHLLRFIEQAPDDPEVATANEMLKYLGG